MKLHLKKRFRNAKAAFHPGEANYQMAINRFGGFDVAYREGTADEKVIAHSFENDIFFAGVPEYQPTASDVVIDIGAHIGTFALTAASKASNGTVHAIEASAETYNYLRVNAALNPALNVIAHRLALTDKDGEVTLHHDRGNWGHSIMKQLSPKGERVPAMSLSSFMAAHEIKDVSFIKFNCEGAEFPILLSTPIELLRKVRMMLVLYHVDLVEGASLEQLLGRLAEAGFTTDIRQKRNTRGWIVASR
ncbi:FkbM family methyltransferase [Aminobacter aganoensis]|uniref:FkbM family methyltransferase n=1 Tax=Aminobacter TaxID=31988 RepID=UPI0012E3A4C6|nr:MULTISPECIES: FkbM family methyltransferase [Aminobacter]